MTPCEAVRKRHGKGAALGLARPGAFGQIALDFQNNVLGGLLLGPAAAGALALTAAAQVGHLAGDVKGLGVSFAFNAIYGVAREGITPRLQVLLQARFGVLQGLGGG